MRRIEIGDGELPDRPDLGDPQPDPGTPLPPALHTWTRLEPLPQTGDLSPALQAGVADPLWLLARQWQFLEFAGEDAGTPIDVRIVLEAAALSRFAPGAPGAGPEARARDYSAQRLPLEVAVEAEPLRATHPRLAAEAGLHLRRMLAAADLSALVDRFVTAYPLAIAEPVPGDAGADWLELARGRALDAPALAAAIAPLRGSGAGALTRLPARPSIPSASSTAVRRVLGRWLAWYEQEFVEPSSPEPSAWNPSRLEYAFAAAAMTPDGELVLAADEYTDGHLDWYSVSAAAGSLGVRAGAPPQRLTLRPTLPAPVGYAGQPADRFWEFEDTAVHFGAVDAGPTDLTRLLLVEFALVYGNDWFVVPAPIPVGSLAQITRFEVRDTFGEVSTVERSRDDAATPWSLFEISGADGLFLAPTLADTLTGPPIEQVALFRDEMANMAWGVERRVQGVSGDGYDRADEASRVAAQQQVDGPPVETQLVYRLATTVPEHWIPFVPVAAVDSTSASPVVELQRRAMLRVERDGQLRRVEPRGVLIGGGGDLRLAEEEVPREGAVVERSFQFARWFDGRALLWLGRRKGAGRGEGASGLRFDALSRE